MHNKCLYRIHIKQCLYCFARCMHNKCLYRIFIMSILLLGDIRIKATESTRVASLWPHRHMSTTAALLCVCLSVYRVCLVCLVWLFICVHTYMHACIHTYKTKVTFRYVDMFVLFTFNDATPSSCSLYNQPRCCRPVLMHAWFHTRFCIYLYGTRHPYIWAYIHYFFVRAYNLYIHATYIDTYMHTFMHTFIHKTHLWVSFATQRSRHILMDMWILVNLFFYRLLSQFECLDTALSFAKARRQVSAAT
jgi:hypothetical protein